MLCRGVDLKLLWVRIIETRAESSDRIGRMNRVIYTVTFLTVDIRPPIKVLVSVFDCCVLRSFVIFIGNSYSLSSRIYNMRSFVLTFPIALAGALMSDLPSTSSALQNILRNTENSDKYQYPTDFTRDLLPVDSHTTSRRSKLTRR